MRQSLLGGEGKSKGKGGERKGDGKVGVEVRRKIGMA